MSSEALLEGSATFHRFEDLKKKGRGDVMAFCKANVQLLAPVTMKCAILPVAVTSGDLKQQTRTAATVFNMCTINFARVPILTASREERFFIAITIIRTRSADFCCCRRVPRM